MLQRPSSCLSRAAEENFPIKKSSSSPRRIAIAMDETPQVLPLYLPSCSIFRRSSAEKLVHLIPILVLLCLLTLWWFSYPVDLVMKDGKIVAIHHLKTTHPVVEVAILASSSSSSISPIPSLPQNIINTHGNGTQELEEEAAHRVNKTSN